MGILLLLVQAVLLAILTFGDMGFDHPGRYGLSFGHAVMFAAAYGVVLICGLAWTLSNREWTVASLQIGVLVLVVVWSLRPLPRYEADRHQHLVSQTKSDVESFLGTRGVATGFERYRGEDCEFVVYRGMTVYYSTDPDSQRRVVAIIANDE